MQQGHKDHVLQPHKHQRLIHHPAPASPPVAPVVSQGAPPVSTTATAPSTVVPQPPKGAMHVPPVVNQHRMVTRAKLGFLHVPYSAALGDSH
jgi:hypothetical protein